MTVVMVVVSVVAAAVAAAVAVEVVLSHLLHVNTEQHSPSPSPLIKRQDPIYSKKGAHRRKDEEGRRLKRKRERRGEGRDLRLRILSRPERPGVASGG